MDLCLPEWFKSNTVINPVSADLSPTRIRSKRKREVKYRMSTVSSQVDEPVGQFNQVLNNYFGFSNPISTTWIQQGLFE
ncbi:unnamed protein product [Thelazia callipaeda]|uniref:Uncharacterized protein n=1 Tax=Thelazia callipaeda TaxID=103827 RepID=A0A0N5CYC5_THECL|nr:unnamed protein product [Thelazia callipaeda]